MIAKLFDGRWDIERGGCAPLCSISSRLLVPQIPSLEHEKPPVLLVGLLNHALRDLPSAGALAIVFLLALQGDAFLECHRPLAG